MNNEFYLSDENTEVKKLSEKSIQDILSEYPFIEDFINENRLIEIGILKNKEQTLKDFLQSLSDEVCEEEAINREEQYKEQRLTLCGEFLEHALTLCSLQKPKKMGQWLSFSK